MNEMFELQQRIIYGPIVFLFIFLSMITCGRAIENNNDRPRVITMHSEEIPEESGLLRLTDEDFKEHMNELKKKVPTGFTTIIQPPFVVIGDESPAIVKQRSERTIKWAVDMLKKDYFDRDPDKIIDIWLFKDDKSYYKHAKELFGDEPTTPFGYFSEIENALIMNINTGGGTLVHEIVHPFMHSNFPECPPWFDEGLASLYEQCREKDGHIYGLTNWRLESLQEAIEQDRVPPFKTLTDMDAHKFYTEDKGTNYGQARYLCYFLQEKGSLIEFYREFYKNRKKDPTGYKTLKQILGEDDMLVFKEKWEAYVLRLTFP
ncbi:MAG: hypothetical protein WBB37_06620 [bacterium]